MPKNQVAFNEITKTDKVFL